MSDKENCERRSSCGFPMYTHYGRVQSTDSLIITHPVACAGGFGMGARKNRKRSQAKRRGKTSLKSYFCRGSSNIMSSRP